MVVAVARRSLRCGRMYVKSGRGAGQRVNSQRVRKLRILGRRGGLVAERWRVDSEGCLLRVSMPYFCYSTCLLGFL